MALVEASVEIDRFRQGAPLEVPLPLVTSASRLYRSRMRSLPPEELQILLLAAASGLPGPPAAAAARPPGQIVTVGNRRGAL